jgi:predicted nucleic acid-binding protein
MPAPARFRSSAASVPDAPQGVVYIDTSALVKLVVREAESDALEHALPDLGELATSTITSIELARAVARARADGAADVADDYAILALLAALAEIPLDVEVRSAAASLTPIELRTLDAIHVASALTLGDDLAAVLAYDKRMQDAARSRGITVLAPGSDSSS